jgi:hypothetical protein
LSSLRTKGGEIDDKEIKVRFFKTNNSEELFKIDEVEKRFTLNKTTSNI